MHTDAVFYIINKESHMYNVHCTMCIIKSFCYDQNEYLAFQANMNLIYYML